MTGHTGTDRSNPASNALARELSGETAIARERTQLCQCGGQPDLAYVAFTTRRFNGKGVNRCC